MTDCIVLGGGMVGVSTALALQALGRDVVLVDRREPGRETSFGNAGLIQSEAVAPYPVPLQIGKLLSYVTGRSNDVVWDLRSLPDWIGPIGRYVIDSLPGRYARIVPHYARLILDAAGDHQQMITASGSEDLISRGGFVRAYRDAKGLEEAVASAEWARREYGVPSSVLDSGALERLVPTLRRPLNGGIHWTSTWACLDPGELVSRYARVFAERGGVIAHGDADGAAPAGSGWRAPTDAGSAEAAELVVALGPWSPAFLRRFGYRVPMVLKRGYHQHFASAAPPALPFLDVESGAMLSPMRGGLRIATGAEVNRIDTPSDPRQLERAVTAARELFDIGEPLDAEPWRGARPCMPDMLPVIGRASRHKNLWFNFGHGHQGFTLGPTTGRLLAGVMAGNAYEGELRAYSRV